MICGGVLLSRRVASGALVAEMFKSDHSEVHVDPSRARRLVAFSYSIKVLTYPPWAGVCLGATAVCLGATIVCLGATGVFAQDCDYKATNVVTKTNSLTADLKLAGSCPLYPINHQGALLDLKLLVEYQTKHRLHVKIYDAGSSVYQIQEAVFPRPANENPTDSELELNVLNNPFSFSVKRKSNGEALFDTAGTPLIFQSQYVRLRTKLPLDPNLYGLGESSDPFRLATAGYHDKDRSGQQYLEYNTIGGVLDFYLFAGPSPANVSRHRSTFAGAGNKMSHWFGDNYSAWDDYRFSISQMLSFAALHNMPIVGSDICGFGGDAQEKMCARWAMLGAFQPFYRNHADEKSASQEFYRWPLVPVVLRSY
ncbi:hypothetical protein ARSEF4850_000309 [Beauveria asiatica]